MNFLLEAMNCFSMQKKSFNTIHATKEDYHYLYPSHIFTSVKPAKVKTVLGSCVAVCLWDSVRNMGGINHFMLPLWNGDGLPSPKYGNIAIEKLAEKLIALGCMKNNLKAKVFGGAESFDHSQNHFKVGQRNIAVAIDTLNDLKINIVAKSLGGSMGRNILFDTYSGEVMMRYIKKVNMQVAK